MSRPKPVSFHILGSRVDRVGFPEALESIQALAQEPSLHQVVTVNTLMLLAAERDPLLRAALREAALAVPESWGVFWASRRLGNPLPSFVPGIDLMEALCAQASRQNQSVYLLGSKPGVAEAAAQALARRYPGLRIAGSRHGYFSAEEEGEVVDAIRAAAPDYLFVGMNMPGQEKWIYRHRSALGARVAMGVGGSFDVLSGRLRRAPAWVRRSGIEWAYRTLQEPWRLLRIKNLPVFMWKVRLSGRKTGPAPSPRP